MHGITPTSITPDILDFCAKVVQGSEPVFLPVIPATGAQPNNCFPVVAQHVEQYGGSISHGWQIWEWRGVLVEAEFHAVWRDNVGKLCDITPKIPPTERILFLHDPERVYNGRQVNNVRRALCPFEGVRLFIDACDEEYALLNRGKRAEEHGHVILEGEDLVAMHALQERKESAYATIMQMLASLRKAGRNDPCPCGSGLKFKKCHR